MRFITPDVAALSPATLSDAVLMEAQRELAAARHCIESAEALVAAEVGRRSSHQLGYDGLAQRMGARDAEHLVQTLSGTSRADARRLVRVGSLVATAASDEPWLRPTLGLDVAAVDVIRTGLGSPTLALSPDILGVAAEQLAAEAPSLDVDALARRARELRDELDIESIGLHEEERRAERYLRLTPLPTGMTRLAGLLDPESAAIVVGAVDAITAPRRGGPRFVSEPENAPDDDRTGEQLMLDALVDIVSVATRAPSGKLFGKRSPAVRVLVTLGDLAGGSGAGHLEGQSDPVSIATVERHACTSGVVPLLFTENGQGVDLGRTQRLHSPRQRELIAARDGGCIFPGCDRPPGWCEAHHIVPWGEGGSTSVEDGVLLCRFHHLLVHNQGWRVSRSGHEYALVPPASRDALRAPVPLVTKSPVQRRLVAKVAS
jgi:hypothetical protein